jgi:uncharacterized protein YdiU (UPF0061 family)
MNASETTGGLSLEYTYASLPEEFFARVEPTPVSEPQLLRVNRPLAEQLGLSADFLASPEGVAYLGGNRVPEGAETLAMAYAGHQFGNWVPQLGDGRAVLLGEVVDRDGVRRDIQLKGAGPTPFSRRGDGRSALGPVLREYVVSEAMAALGIPTTRALAMVATGDLVQRERAEPGGILARVASGHIRVGTFQYFHGRGMRDSVRALADYVIERGYANSAEASNPYRALLDEVVRRQAEHIAQWLLVGFIHGVMNTDNMSVLGETIDYGPCAFMDTYHPQTVYSSIDQGRRYAYDQQPQIGLWNLTRFAETLLPLLAESEDEAVESAQEALGAYGAHFDARYHAGLCEKMGLLDADEELAAGLLHCMTEQKADFTLTFRGLSDVVIDAPDAFAEVRQLFDTPEAFDAWAGEWRERIASDGRDDAARRSAMRAVNPAFIPRNHRVKQLIDAITQDQNPKPLEDLLTVTSRPYDDHPELREYARPPEPHEVVHQTFCGT